MRTITLEEVIKAKGIYCRRHRREGVRAFNLEYLSINDARCSFATGSAEAFERPDTWVTVCTGHIGDTSSPRGGSDALEGVFGYG
jgi:hypothetical protein